jgi:predicted transposase YbfD/YdcC
MFNIMEQVEIGKFKSLYKFLQEIPDYREINHLTMYSLADLLLVIILGIMAGMKSQRKIAEYARNNSNLLITPSKSMINRVFINLDFKQLQIAIKSWCQQIFDILGGQVVAIDGKSMNGYIENTGTLEANTLFTVSAYCHGIGMVVDWIGLEGSKSGEGSRFRELLNNPNIKIVTGDALHCNNITIKEILNQKKDYLVNCKQKRLLPEVQRKGVLADTMKQVIDGKLREVEVYKLPHNFKVTKTYINKGKKQKIIKNKTISWTDCQIKSYIKVQYFHKDRLIVNNYISNLEYSATEFDTLIKGHWGIENGLHWSKDVVFKEDRHRTSNLNSSYFLTACFSFVISIFHFHSYTSIEKATLKYCNRVAECLNLIGIPRTVLKNWV